MQTVKPKILFIVQLPPPMHGASAMNAYAYNSQLLRSEYDCRALPLQFTTSISDIGSFSFKKIGLMLFFCLKLIYTLIIYRPQLVYFSLAPVGSAFYRDALFVCIVKCFRVKLLIHLHGKGIAKAAASSRVLKKMYQFTFKKTFVIILSKVLQSDIESVYKKEAFVLPNGIPSLIKEGAMEKSKKPVFLYLSNLVRSKGYELFVQSLKQLHEEGLDFKAYIVGASYDVTIDDLSRTIEQQVLSEKVKVLGPLYGKEKEAILALANVFVFPTYYPNEAFPISILEAMRSGLCVISTNNGAIGEIIENKKTGFVIKQKNLEMLIEKMRYLIKHPEELQAFGSQAKEKFEAKYTISSFERKLFTIVQQVLK